MKRLLPFSLSVILLLLMGCSLSSQETASLPTLAALPSLASTVKSTKSATPEKTFEATVEVSSVPILNPIFPTVTLPAVNRLEIALTRYFQDESGIATQFAAYVDRIAALQAPKKLTSNDIARLATNQWRNDVNNAYLTVESEIIVQAMPINDGSTKSEYISIAGDKEYLKLFYRYTSDTLPFSENQKRIPYLLCELKNAGLEDLVVAIYIDLRASDGKERGSSYFCADAKITSRINCVDPGRVNIDRMGLSRACIY